jgi:3'(2'), 5'-bisphosphate nucleotidase
MDLPFLLPPVIALAHEAGRNILQIYHDDFAVTEKADSSPLTAADLASHKVIVTGLKTLTPDIPILSEESAAIDVAERKTWQRFWLVDPLDGTKEFIKRNGEFTVNIALIDQHQPVLGVVLIPVQNRCYYAARSHGAFCQAGSDDAHRITVSKPCHDPVRVVSSRSHAGAAQQQFLERLGNHELVSIGSSLKFCLIAEGLADVYPRLGPTSEWDTAAAQCVVEQAGGQVITLDGNRLLYNTKDSLLNPHFMVLGDDRRDWLTYIARN